MRAPYRGWEFHQTRLTDDFTYEDFLRVHPQDDIGIGMLRGSGEAVAAALGVKRLRTLYWGGWTGVAFTNPLTRWVSRVAQVISIDPRRGARANLALAAAVLKRGHGLIWFPEGQRTPPEPRGHPHIRRTTMERTDPSDAHAPDHGPELVPSPKRVRALLFETGLPTRYYLPEPNVRLDLLVPSDTITRCPYKGETRYHSVVTGGIEAKDVFWTYPYPTVEVVQITGLFSFLAEQVDQLFLDGEPQPAPDSP